MVAGKRNGEDREWEFLDNSSLPGREDPPVSHDAFRHENYRGMDARNNLEKLRKLLSSSTPGGTPETLDSQQQSYAGENSQQDVDISREISSLINFVDNFEFRSPVPTLKFCQHQEKNHSKSDAFDEKMIHSSPSRFSVTTKDSEQSFRNPLMDRTNGLTTKENTIQEEPVEREDYSRNSNLDIVAVSQDPEGKLLYSDRSDVELSPNHRLPEIPEENDWDKFNHLVRQVENALQEANQERETTRNWARQVRENTNSWVDEQRALIEQERASKLLVQEMENGSPREQQAFYEAKIEHLENTIRGLELDLKTAELHHQTNERRLHNIIQYQQENLRKLEGGSTLEKSRNTPWSKHQANVHNLEVRTQALRDTITPWPQGDHPDSKFSDPRQQLMKASSDQDSLQSTDNLQIQKKICFTEDSPEKANTNRPPATKTIHKPFGGTTPGSVGLRKVVHSSKLPPRISDSRNKGVVTFANGARKEIRKDGSSVIRFSNGDVQIFSGESIGSVAYYHAKSQVIQVGTIDGSEIFEFPNGQVERHYPDGRKIVKFSDGTKKRIFPNGLVETFLPCGKYLILERPDGSKNVKHL